jgi:hypothetical protein
VALGLPLLVARSVVAFSLVKYLGVRVLLHGERAFTVETVVPRGAPRIARVHRA